MKLQRRDTDHVRAWSQERVVRSAQAQRVQEQLEKQLEEARLELAQRPVNVIHENLDVEIVAEAESRRDAAYRSRDLAMRELCKIRLLHREDGQGQCGCGNSYSKCKTTKVIYNNSALEKWESGQIARMRKNLDHSLPDNHPVVLDRRQLW
jgi:hypothetical protein